MHPADITAALQKSGCSQAALSRKLQVTKAAVSQIVNSKQRSRRIECAIARTTQLPLATLWPQHYGIARDDVAGTRP